MRSTDSSRPLSRHQAVAMVARAKRPESIPAKYWGNVRLPLLAIAEHYPTAYPNRVTLGAELGRSDTTVKRYIRMAVDAGLLVRRQRQGESGQYRSNRYLLQYHRRGSWVILGPWVMGDPLTGTSNELPAQQEPEALRASGPKETNHRRRPVGGKKVPMSDWDPDFHDVAPEEYLEEARPSRKRTPTPVAQVTAHFREEWEKRSTQPGLVMVILFDSVAAFQARVKQDCFEREGKTVAEVNASIDQFLHQVDARRVLPKNGQPLWKLWWNQRSKYQRPAAVVHRQPTVEDLRRRLEDRREGSA